MRQKSILTSTVVLGLLLVLVAALSVQLPQGAAHAQDRDQEAPALGIAAPQAQVGTAFTYQGWLTDGGSPADGEYDLRFDLYEAAVARTSLGTVTVPDHQVTAGLFTVHLDFGEVFTGTARFLGIAVRPGDSDGVYTPLTPRQELTPVPYALALPGLWTQQNATSPNLIGGHTANSVAPGKVGAVIGGGGNSSYPNTVLADYSTVGGGTDNSIGNLSRFATIGGGSGNIIAYDSDFATIGGGYNNESGDDTFAATIGGGYSNLISDTAAHATIPGGGNNEANGNYAFAAGRLAQANNQGCFVWGDSTNAEVECNNNNRWVVQASGGVYFYTTSNLGTGMYLAAGSESWQQVSASDRNLKEGFSPVDTQEVLARLAELPITTWSYKAGDPGVRHMAPTAQDFFAAFGLGEDDTHLSALDTNGVALAAIQGLYAQNQELEQQVEALQQQNADLEARLTALERGGASRSSALGLPTWLLLGGLVLAGGVVLQRRRNGGAA